MAATRGTAGHSPPLAGRGCSAAMPNSRSSRIKSGRGGWRVHVIVAEMNDLLRRSSVGSRVAACPCRGRNQRGTSGIASVCFGCIGAGARWGRSSSFPATRAPASAWSPVKSFPDLGWMGSPHTASRVPRRRPLTRQRLDGPPSDPPLGRRHTRVGKFKLFDASHPSFYSQAEVARVEITQAGGGWVKNKTKKKH
jgi:hypothetical protein